MNHLRHFAILALTSTLVLGMAGCGYDRHPAVPADAMSLAQGEGRLAARADFDGDVYVVDERRNEIVYSGKIEDGETVSVDPRENEIRIGTRVVSENELRSGNRHRIYFDRSTTVSDRVTIERRQSVE